MLPKLTSDDAVLRAQRGHSATPWQTQSKPKFVPVLSSEKLFQLSPCILNGANKDILCLGIAFLLPGNHERKSSVMI